MNVRYSSQGSFNDTLRVEALIQAKPTQQPYDVHGASVYVIVIVAIYALTIVVMIGATMNDRTKSRLVESQVAYYLESPSNIKREAEKLRAKLSAAPSPQTTRSYLRLPQIEEAFESSGTTQHTESA